VVVRALSRTDDRSTFRSTSPELERFFRQYAGQEQFKHSIGITYVAVEATGLILGFVTVAAGALEADEIPSAIRKRLPAHPVPVLRLARLATHADFLGQGVGRELTHFVFQLALEQSARVGCLGIVVDAKPESVDFYAKLGFVELTPLEGKSDARPQPTPMFLWIRTIAAVQSETR